MCSQFLTGIGVCAFQNPFNNIYMFFALFEQVQVKYADCQICQYKLTCQLLPDLCFQFTKIDCSVND